MLLSVIMLLSLVTVPALAAETAKPTSSKVYVNSISKSFDAYNIKEYNYFKLRDLAYVISGSTKQFEVKWDGAKNAINLVSKTAYTPEGTEMAKGNGKSKSASVSTAAVYVDGNKVSLSAYNIDGFNYFKLRDVMKLFDVSVEWSEKTNSIALDTTKSYVEEGQTVSKHTALVTTVPAGYTAIRTVSELNTIQNNLSGKFILMNDIDLAGYTWSPMSTFTGVLDGNGFSINNINCVYRDNNNSWTYCGLFSVNKGIIVNLGMEGGSIKISKAPANTKIWTGYSVGSFAGKNMGIISHCYSDITITATAQGTCQGFVGGLVGSLTDGGYIRNSNFFGTLNGTVSDPTKSTTEKCFLGGIAGKLFNGTISNCFNRGSMNTEYLMITMGGIANTLVDGTMENCYNAGEMNGVSAGKKGGVASIISKDSKNLSVKNCYYLDNVSYSLGSNAKAIGTKLSSSEMSAAANFKGFDFTSTWAMGNGSYKYPALYAGKSYAAGKMTLPGISSPVTLDLPVKIINKTGIDIYGLYLSPANSDDWGDDVLGDDILSNGRSSTMTLHLDKNALVWDMMMTDSEGNSVELYGLDVSKAKVTGATIELTFNSSTGVGAATLY